MPTLLPAETVAETSAPRIPASDAKRPRAYISADEVSEFRLSDQQRRALEELAEWRKASEKSCIIIGKPTYSNRV